MLCFAASLSQCLRMIVRDNFPSSNLPIAAARAPTSANDQPMCAGSRNPKNENTIQVGGANAGMTLSRNTTKNKTSSGITIFSHLNGLLILNHLELKFQNVRKLATSRVHPGGQLLIRRITGNFGYQN
jgi:hypothetical protein